MNFGNLRIPELRRIFNEGFSARDVAEPLASFDATCPAQEALSVMTACDFDVVGVRHGGLLAAYADRTTLTAATCGAGALPLTDALVIEETSSLADVVLGLRDRPRLFVRVLGTVGGIVTPSDLQKPPVRMWLFGMITLVEMRMSRLIQQCLGDTWQTLLSEGRLQKAAALLEERRRRSQNLDLFDCLQFADKGQIIARSEQLRDLTRFTSRRQVEEVCRMLENLRNNLAHSQDIIATDWETVVNLAADLDRVIGGTHEVQATLQD